MRVTRVPVSDLVEACELLETITRERRTGQRSWKSKRTQAVVSSVTMREEDARIKNDLDEQLDDCTGKMIDTRSCYNSVTHRIRLLKFYNTYMYIYIILQGFSIRLFVTQFTYMYNVNGY